MLYWLQKNSVQEGFLEFIPLQSATSESIATELREHLAAIVPEDQQSKLICQAYDGASVMRGATAGVQRKIKDAYPKCLLYPLLHTSAQPDHATGRLSHFRRENFFFWPRWICQLFFQDHPSKHVSTSSNIRKNFHSQAINTVFKHREDLVCCFENTRDVTLTPIPSERQDPWPCYWNIRTLSSFWNLFHHIMPHVDLLYAKLQKKNIDSGHIRGSVQQFEQDIQRIRYSCWFFIIISLPSL